MTTARTSFAPSRQLIMLGAMFAVVAALLAGAYWLYLRPGYAVLVDGVRQPEAASIVAELDKRDVPYQLRDGGTAILVPADQADATRLAIAGSNAVATGQVGFELFNKSDMGLTNFAQKINYQRALQGELVRTIVQMDGVESARVHLALPERALFRDDRTAPSAAVAVTLKIGQVFDPARVSGIQRLVAASVPDLAADHVSVLDARGQVVSRDAPGAGAPDTADMPAAMEERAAVERYYRARARSAIESVLPTTKFTTAVLALPRAAPAAYDDIDWRPEGAGEGRNYRLRVRIVTATTLDPAQQATTGEAVSTTLGLRPSEGDELAFETGPVTTPPAASPWPRPASASVAATTPTAPVEPHEPLPWAWLVAGVVALACAFVVWRRRGVRQQRRLAPADRDAFVLTLQRQLALAEEGDHAPR